MVAGRKLKVGGEGTLMPFLMEALQGMSRTSVKSFLTHRQVAVNGVVATRHDTPLREGDEVEILPGWRPEVLSHRMLKIVFEDEYLIVADKQCGLLSVGTDSEREKTAFHILSEHVKRSDPSAKVFIVHRLDRETSGLMVVAKSEEVKDAMQRNWKQVVTRRTYVAVVEGVPSPDEGIISAPLAENKNLKVYVSRGDEGRDAVTRYKVAGAGRGVALLELELETGRKNQIRAHLEHIGHPVAGDRKYGSKATMPGRICLHAQRLHFIHPVTGREMGFDTRIPALFTGLL